MHHKHATRAAYEAHAADFDQEFESHMRRYNMEHVERFLAALPGPRILDLGSGPGNYAVEFKARGHDPFCGDFSPAMVDLCLSKGLAAGVLDLETFELRRCFDGVWANACLLHLPKTAIPDALERIARHVEPHGVFACAMKEGRGEGFKEDPEYPGAPRYFSLFTDQEFRALLAARFEVVGFDRTPSGSGKTVFIKYLARLRAS